MLTKSDYSSRRNSPYRSPLRRFVIGILLFSMLGTSAFANTTASQFYVVKKDDTLSGILNSLQMAPLYGPNGTVKKAIACQNLRRNGNLILPGDIIHLQYAADVETSKYIQVLESGEVIIDRFKINPKKQISDLNEEKKYLRRTASENSPCPKSESSTNETWNSDLRLPQSNVQNNVEEVIPTPDAESTFVKNRVSKSYLLFEATDSLSKQDLRTLSGGYSEIVSKSSPGIRLQWREVLSENWELELSYENHTINQVAPENHSLDGTSSFTDFTLKSLKTLGSEASRNQESLWKLGPVLKYRTEPITTRINLSTVRLESPQIFLLGADVENQQAIGMKNSGVHLKTNLSLFYAPRASQSSYVISNGVGFEADVRLIRPIQRNLDLSAGISYGLFKYSSNLGEHATQDITFGLGVLYRFDNSTPANHGDEK